MNRLRGARAEIDWYIQAQGRVWGPYAMDRIETFVEEGRVKASTPAARTPGGPFIPAALQGELRQLFVAKPESNSFPAASVAGAAGASTAPAKPLLVFAVLANLEAAAFEAALAAYGPNERISIGLWLIRTSLGVSALRNTLSRRLRGGDTLLVVEADLDRAAWFNLSLAEERKLRALWVD